MTGSYGQGAKTTFFHYQIFTTVYVTVQCLLIYSNNAFLKSILCFQLLVSLHVFEEYMFSHNYVHWFHAHIRNRGYIDLDIWMQEHVHLVS